MKFLSALANQGAIDRLSNIDKIRNIENQTQARQQRSKNASHCAFWPSNASLSLRGYNLAGIRALLPTISYFYIQVRITTIL